MRWLVETLDDTVDAEIEGLPAGLQARLVRLMEMVESVGLDQLHEPQSSIWRESSGSFVLKQWKELRGVCTLLLPDAALSFFMFLSRNRRKHLRAP